MIALLALHLQKIEMANAVWVVMRDGYVGPDTQREIEYARLRKKPVFFWQTDTPLSPADPQ